MLSLLKEKQIDMNIKQLNKSKTPIIKMDETLSELKEKVVFKEKVDFANQVLKSVGLPKTSK